MSTTGRQLVLAFTVLGWLCCGIQMGMTSLMSRNATQDLLDEAGTLDRARQLELEKKAELSPSEEKELADGKSLLQGWYASFICAFLFGAAAGGYVFGRLGDAIGRSKALALSLFCLSVFALAGRVAPALPVLLGLWFLASLGIGGCWPNGVALLSEVWSGLSRPMVAGIMGSAANVGLFIMGSLASSERTQITPDNWRWVLWLPTGAFALAVLALFFLPESPRWLEERDRPREEGEGSPSKLVFRPPYLGLALLGIVLATVPLVGGWGSANWMVPWADAAGQAADPPNHQLKGQVQMYRALTGIVGSLLGGWIAAKVGRRLAYGLYSAGALGCALYTFWLLEPTDASFLWWVAALGFFNGAFFGWLPLFLPELFPTRIRATGSGVSFNFGRISTASTLLATSAMIRFFEGDHARIGRTTSWIFAIGLIAICFAPDTTRSRLDEDEG